MGRQKSRSLKIKVPEEVLDQLEPYAEIFESIVIPLVLDLGDKEVLMETRDQLHRLIARFQNERGEKQHSVLVYYGLMLCCYYCGQENFFTRRRPNITTLELLTKARLLIRLSYQYHLYEELIFICG